MARPGAAIQAFCEPVTTTSMPQASISKGTAPRPDTLSTRIRASGRSSRIAAASSAIGFITPGRGLVVGQQDRLDVRVGAEPSRGSRRRPPHSPTRRRAWSRPPRRCRRSSRSGHRTPRSRRPGPDRPGESVLTIAASRPPETAQVSIATSLVGAEERLHPVEDPAEHRRKLRPAVIDHLASRQPPGRSVGGRSDPGCGGWARSGPRGSPGRRCAQGRAPRRGSATVSRWSQKRSFAPPKGALAASAVAEPLTSDVPGDGSSIAAECRGRLLFRPRPGQSC